MKNKWGFSIRGGTPIAGWFIIENPKTKWWCFQIFSLIFGNLQIAEEVLQECECLSLCRCSGCRTSAFTECWGCASTASAEASPGLLGPEDELHGRASAAPNAAPPSTFVRSVSAPAADGAAAASREAAVVYTVDSLGKPSHHFGRRMPCAQAAHSRSHSKHRALQQPWALIGTDRCWASTTW